MAEERIKIANEDAVQCPRCGYDQRGVVAAWKNSCPLEGVCSECGLKWPWMYILNLRYGQPAWCIEFIQSWRQLLRRAAATLAMSLTPWQFWWSLTIFQSPRWRRIMLYFLFLLSIVYPAWCLGQGLHAWQEWHRLKTGGIAYTVLSTGTGASIPAGQYAFNCRTVVSPWIAVGQTIVLPFSKRSPGALVPAPSTLAMLNAKAGVGWTLIGPHPPPASFIDLKRYRFALQLFGLELAIVLLCPFGFVFLPVSRERHHVLWRHVIRITAYSFGILTLIAAFVIMAPPASETFARRYAVWLAINPAFIASAIILPAMLFVWWGFASSRYLRIRHAWGTSAAMVTMAALIALAVDLRLRGFMFWF